MFDSRIIINSTAEFYISISYLKDLAATLLMISTQQKSDGFPRRNISYT